RSFGFNYIVHCVFPPRKKPLMMNFGVDSHIRKESTDTAKHAIDFCRKIDAPLYSMHTGYLCPIDEIGNQLGPLISQKRAVENITFSLREVCDFARSYGIKVAIENSTARARHLLFFSPAQYGQLLRNVGSKNLGLMIDLGHLKASSVAHKFDPAAYFREVQHMVFALHVHEYRKGKDHLGLSSPDILKRFGVSQLCKNPYITLESNGLDTPSLEKSIRVLKQAEGQLKSQAKSTAGEKFNSLSCC
ncbi:MAG: sugar phosphate isomerase/epimerase family protein, partial [Candidatus Woesearchaeota archaeon]